MAIRNFVLLNRAEARALTERIEAPLARWQREWCAADVRRAETLPDAVVDASFIASCRWRTGACAGGYRVSIGWAAVGFDAVVSLLVGDCARAANGESAPAAASELERSALEALIASLLHDLAPAARRATIEWDAQPLAEPDYDRRQGGFAVRLRLGTLDMVVALSAAVVAECLSAQSRPRQPGRRPVSARSALATQRVAIEVYAGAAELTLSELASLGVGDVITLDHRLDQPLIVRAAGGAVLGGGHLGVHGGRRAVQLAVIHPNEEV